MEKTRKLSPRKAKTYNAICRLKTDNCDSGNFWMLIHEKMVTIAKQKKGEDSEFMISIDKKDFGKLIDWYNWEQILPPKKRRKNTYKKNKYKNAIKYVKNATSRKNKI